MWALSTKTLHMRPAHSIQISQCQPAVLRPGMWHWGLGAWNTEASGQLWCWEGTWREHCFPRPGKAPTLQSLSALSKSLFKDLIPFPWWCSGVTPGAQGMLRCQDQPGLVTYKESRVRIPSFKGKRLSFGSQNPLARELSDAGSAFGLPRSHPNICLQLDFQPALRWHMLREGFSRYAASVALLMGPGSFGEQARARSAGICGA